MTATSTHRNRELGSPRTSRGLGPVAEGPSRNRRRPRLHKRGLNRVLTLVPMLLLAGVVRPDAGEDRRSDPKSPQLSKKGPICRGEPRAPEPGCNLLASVTSTSHPTDRSFHWRERPIDIIRLTPRHRRSRSPAWSAVTPQSNRSDAFFFSPNLRRWRTWTQVSSVRLRASVKSTSALLDCAKVHGSDTPRA